MHRTTSSLIAALAVTLAAMLTADAGGITGVVKMQGKAPKPKVVDRSADAKCIAMHPEDLKTERFVTGKHDGENTLVANVFVYVSAGLPEKEWPVPSETRVLDQNGCKYAPHVTGIMVGQSLQIRNSDKTTHNVHSLSKRSKQFNSAQTSGAPALMKSFSATEVMCKLKCDMHPWMSCYIGVLDHPFYAVTGIDGSYTIDGLAAGTYEITTWHEKMRTRKNSVTVTEDGATTLDVLYTKKKKK